MTPEVTILTNERDFAADTVVSHLVDLGANVRRINIDAARTAAVPPWSPSTERGPSTVWWRQFEFESHPEDLIGVDDVLIERAQWRSWLSVLRLPGARWVNDLWAARRAEDKVEQLRTATSIGFHVPSTLITNDSVDARRFSDQHGDVVVKTLASAFFSFSDESFVFTESISHPALAEPSNWHTVPLIIQKRLVDALDARVVSLGDRTFGARCDAAGLDWRKTPYDADQWSVWDVPASIAELCSRYRERLGLEYAAFDFMIDDEVWFLEANQAGEFAFIDRALDLGISRALAELLVELGSL